MTGSPGKRALVLRHTPIDDLGAFRPALLRAGYAIDIVEPFHDDVRALDPLEPDLVAVMGGAIGVHDAGQYPFLTDEIQFVEKRLASGRPLLGSCLGAQIMAAASGARVYRNTRVEAGYLPISLTEAGRQSCLIELEAAGYMSPHWHADAFDLPAGATCLAGSALTENQAFSMGSNILGLQFHIEADPRITGAWMVAYIGDIERAGISVADFRAAIDMHGAATAAAGAAMLTRWLAELRAA